MILVALGKCAVCVLDMSLSLFLAGESLVSRVFLLFGDPTQDRITTTTIKSLVDRGGGVEDFQHCIDITQGQEERIPET